MKKARILKSQLDSIKPPKPGKIISNIKSAIEDIINNNSTNISYYSITHDIYMMLSYSHGAMVVNTLQEENLKFFNQIFDYNPLEFDPDLPDRFELSRKCIKGAAVIINTYEAYSSRFIRLFKCVERDFNGKTNIHEFINNQFISVVNNSSALNSLVNAMSIVFDYFLENLTLEDLEENQLFQDAISARELIHFASQEKMDTLITVMTQCCSLFFKKWIEQPQLVDIEPPIVEEDEEKKQEELLVPILNTRENDLMSQREAMFYQGPARTLSSPEKIKEDKSKEEILLVTRYCEDAFRLIELDKTIASRIFNEKLGQKFQSIAYSFINQVDTSAFLYCTSKIKIMCRKRDFNAIKLFSDLNQNTEEAIYIIAMETCKSIEEDVVEFSDLPKTLEFYIKVMHLFPRQVKQFNDSIRKLVNKNEKDLHKNLLRAIHERATKHEGDIERYAKILMYIESKEEFLDNLVKQVAKRFVVAKSEDQIDYETNIYSQLSKVSKEYNMSIFQALINEAAKSFHMHLGGPVLVIHATAWPFPSPYPNPVKLTEITDGIVASFKRHYSGKVLKFPINYWVITLKDIIHNCAIVCSGVQTEVLLHLNRERFITETSLSPRISDGHLLPALKTMIHKSAPILVAKNDGTYELNAEWFPKEKVIQLRTPSWSEVPTSSQNNEVKENALDSFIVMTLKGNHSMRISDLDNLILTEFSNKFAVTPDDIRKRVASLTVRRFVSTTSNGRIQYET